MNYINELEELEDILDSLIPEEEPSIFTEEYSMELIETALQMMDEYMNENPSAITEEDFLETFQEDIQELFYIQFEDEIIFNEEIEDDLNEILNFAFEIFFETCYQGRSFKTETHVITESNKEILQKKINNLKSKPQPPQRTKEWYEFRYNLITASNAYKAFESQSMINQLIYEKCLPLKQSDDNYHTPMVNVNTTLHWGQKYEPLSVMLYEEMYQTKVGDFGCIQHEKYKFLGASPDGINIDQNSERFGRMLEIKNIVNREITGIPKKEYWIQMQLQMEVCDLDECDFLETKFTEFADMASFYEENNSNNTDNYRRGIIMYFHTKDSRPYYVYKPLHLDNKDEIDVWEEKMVELHESTEYNMLFIKNIYWKLEKISCVLVKRNKKWFEDHISELEKVWKIIEQERISGYQHRAPNKRPPKLEQSTKISNYFAQGCLLDLNKIKVTKLSNQEDDNSNNSNNNTINNININTQENQEFVKIIKIRTESMDETKANL
jgi:putative phage-type endonuclease